MSDNPIYHFRDLDGREVDFVLGRDDGMIVGCRGKVINENLSMKLCNDFSVGW